MAKLYQDKDWLWEQYIVQEKSSFAIAKGAGCSGRTIRDWLHRHGIPTRSISEGTFLATRNSVIITPGLLEFLTGEILGDGCVRIPGHYSTRYTHSSKYEKYLIWLSERFDGWSIEQSGRIIKRKNKQSGFNGAISYSYTSRAYPELVPIYNRWYPSGKKAVPQDLKLTPIMARQWYIGDGGFDSYKSEHPGVVFNTQGFDKESAEYLVKELCDLGFKATRRPSDNTIHLSAHSVEDFLAWIGPCPISCYDYKWGCKRKDNKVKT